MIATVEDIDQNADFAVASFIDKPNGVFGTTNEYVYQTNLALSSDNAAVIASVNALSTQNGLDVKEAQLEALMQVALRPGEIGFRADTKRIVMLSTDSAFHQAGDHSAPANNGDAILDGNGVGEDYPSIAQAAAALVATGIFPVFSVTADQKALYQTLVNDLGTGAVVVLSANSSDFADAVRVAIAKACGHVTQEGTEAEDDMEGTELEDGMFGLGGDDLMHGRAGDDLVDGGSGNDTIKGGKGADELRGGTGTDILDGGKARDTLNGGLGNDTLTGGRGRDTFVINPGGGADTITDFENGIDVIDLSAFHRFEGVAAVMSALQVGASVVLNLPGGTSVTLQAFTLAELGLEDVILEPFGDAPVAVNDIATATANKQTLIDVLANDTDVDADTLSIVSVGSSPNATIKIKGGMISYKADSSFSGADSFTYTITDGNFTHTATVNITVLPNLIGDNLANVLVGTQFDDLIKGKGGDDTITGNDGNDTILGGDGRDEIYGSGGFKAGVSDNDTMSGGLGADNFIFELALDQNLNGDDIITDYDITEDRIQLDGDVLVQLTDTVAGVLIEQITGGSILVEDVLAADIRATISGLNEVL